MIEQQQEPNGTGQEAYEPPVVEDVETEDGTAVTSAGADGTAH